MAGLAFCVYGQDVEYAMERRVVSEALEFNADRVTAAVDEGIGKVTNASDLDELYAFRAQYTGGASELARASMQANLSAASVLILAVLMVCVKISLNRRKRRKNWPLKQWT